MTYVAETGMLPVLKKDGATQRLGFLHRLHARWRNQQIHASRHLLLQRRAGFIVCLAAPWRARPAPRENERRRHVAAAAVSFGGQRVFNSGRCSDLVFIDPVATGFSRAAKDEKDDAFFGDTADLDSVGEFIRLWTTRHDRWLSPKYLCGESYGVFRAAGLAEHLRSRYGMYLNGLVLISGVLDFATIWNNPGNDLPYPLDLPAYTAAAHFHKKLPPDLQKNLDKALAESRKFAKGEYASRVGTRLGAARR